MFGIRERLTAQWTLAKRHFLLVLFAVAALWVVFVVDALLPDSWVRLTDWGVHPRQLRGLPCILSAPFLHVDFWHLLANTLPLLLLGWILVFSGVRLLFTVCFVTALTSGLGAWAMGTPGMVHEGASGILFGLLGFILARGWFARRLLWTLTSIGVGMLYVGEVLSLLRNDPRISWSSHFWGFAGGILYAWWTYGRHLVMLVPAASATLPAPSKPSNMPRR